VPAGPSESGALPELEGAAVVGFRDGVAVAGERVALLVGDFVPIFVGETVIGLAAT